MAALSLHAQPSTYRRSFCRVAALALLLALAATLCAGALAVAAPDQAYAEGELKTKTKPLVLQSGWSLMLEDGTYIRIPDTFSALQGNEIIAEWDKYGWKLEGFVRNNEPVVVLTLKDGFTLESVGNNALTLVAFEDKERGLIPTYIELEGNASISTNARVDYDDTLLLFDDITIRKAPSTTTAAPNFLIQTKGKGGGLESIGALSVDGVNMSVVSNSKDGIYCKNNDDSSYLGGLTVQNGANVFAQGDTGVYAQAGIKVDGSGTRLEGVGATCGIRSDGNLTAEGTLGANCTVIGLGLDCGIQCAEVLSGNYATIQASIGLPSGLPSPDRPPQAQLLTWAGTLPSPVQP